MNTGGYVLLSCLYTHVCVCAEMEMGQWVWVMGQMGHHFWMGHVGNGLTDGDEITAQ